MAPNRTRPTSGGATARGTAVRGAGRRSVHPAWWAIVAGGLLIGGAWYAWGRAAPPPLPADPEVRTTIDALFTALTSRRESLLDDCRRRLAEQRAAGRLADDSADYLTGVIDEAQGGRWEPAARRLYAFIQPR